MNKTIRQVSFSVWFEEDDFSYDNHVDYSSALEQPAFSREKLHQLLDEFLNDIEEEIEKNR
ncbi:hypothetical protein [Thermoflavimicrobium dichotomicum]|uniref:Uncharacterized protein n=1 Tax=Thermoflavimicrobium dichotomicum TaxID=46223 RepID=A0A1I3RWL9_9BACL|nr:hypothetical protein [Thermoflavimicrobium dichotomicum]SFJ49789.1 hypothetical protein SAMN05421852_11127 [Thermoflavimicrobium dichotomicum]